MNIIHKLAISAGTAALAISLAGCERYEGQDGKANSGAVTAAIKADEKKWNDEFKAKDSEALVGHYTDDAFFVAPGVKANGSMELRKAYAEAVTDPNFQIQFASDRIDVAGSGDIAYSRGHFEEKYTDPKTRQVMGDSGSYITVYKKQQDGSWKAQEDFAVADPSSTKPVEPGKPATRAKMTSF